MDIKTQSTISRREFLQLGGLGLGGMALSRLGKILPQAQFPDSERLGRVCFGRWDLKAQPDYDSATVGQVFDDQIVVWLREVRGRWPWRNNQRWIETPDGYLWSSYVQPVWNKPQATISEVPDTSIGPGLWMEISVPYVDAVMVNPPPRHPWFRDLYEKGLPLRFYYSQVVWVDQVRTTDDGRVLYRVNEKYGNRGDIFWVDGRGLRPITAEELAPISPDVEDKRVVIDITDKRQTLSCFEGNQEVYFCRISSGKRVGATPLGTFPIWRKLVSLHMEGGTAVEGWDVCGVGWVNLFTANGVAIHSTYWHNNFGEVESNGCVNVLPEDSKWIYRWTNPGVSYDPGEKTITDFSATRVSVIQA